jgi:hypothetical protein
MCGDNTVNETVGEECDGFNDDACPGMCDAMCHCP